KTSFRRENETKFLSFDVLVKRGGKIHGDLAMFFSRRRGHAKFSFHEFISIAVGGHIEQLIGGHRFCKNRAHRYYSTFPTISRIWNGRHLTFEKGTALISKRARIIVQS